MTANIMRRGGASRFDVSHRIHDGKSRGFRILYMDWVEYKFGWRKRPLIVRTSTFAQLHYLLGDGHNVLGQNRAEHKCSLHVCEHHHTSHTHKNNGARVLDSARIQRKRVIDTNKYKWNGVLDVLCVRYAHLTNQAFEAPENVSTNKKTTHTPDGAALDTLVFWINR